MTRLLVAVLIAMCSFSSYATEQTPERIATKFFDTLAEGKSDQAVDNLFSINPMFKEKTQQLQLLKSQLKGILDIYGQATGAELVVAEELAPSLQRRVYITKHEYHPMTWEMYFYKAKIGWIPDQVLFVDQYQIIGKKL